MHTPKQGITEGRKQRVRKTISKPQQVAPMLCTLVREPVNDDNFLYEIKWDGYRIIAHVDKKDVLLRSRGGLDYTAKYPPVKKALLSLKKDCVLDGEVVVFNEKGVPDFDALQKFNGHNGPITYVVFDLLWLNGESLLDRPLSERKAALKKLVDGHEGFLFSESFDDGPALYQQMLDRNLEGIVAKRKDSVYEPGERNYNWLKTPTVKRQEFVIGGWAESTKARAFKSLLFGAYSNGTLEWIGRSGGGYKDAEMPGILRKLKALEIDQSPFINSVLDTKGAVIHWVKPQLVAYFSFATWTKSGRIRKPATFLGFRKDKKATQVVREVPVSAGEVEAVIGQAPQKVTQKQKRNDKKTTSAASNWPKIEGQKITSRDTLSFGDCEIQVTNMEQEIWKGLQKIELLQYYHDVSSYLLPHLEDRPQSLHIKQNGALAPGFYIKDMEGREPDCGTVFTDQRKHKAAGKRSVIDYLVCNNEATLLWMVNLGCIEINPWMSRYHKPNEPDFINIDLDPSDGDFEKAIKTAQAAKKILDGLKLKAFPKTSGKTGIHIYIPCRGFNNEQGRALSTMLCERVHEQVPRITTTNVNIESRGNRLFVDNSQNDYADTLAAPYSARPAHQPTVSTPLEWKEIRSGLKPEKFTIYTVRERLAKKGDLFQKVLDEKIAKHNTPILLGLLDILQ